MTERTQLFGDASYSGGNREYVSKLKELLPAVTEALLGLNVPQSAVDFDAPHRRGRRPGNAQSQFLANRAMGDWAERSIQDAGNRQLPDFRFVKYGNADNIIAGDPAFPDFYDRYQEELANSGKRPDLLVFHSDDVEKDWQDDVSSRPLDELADISETAIAAIEVRSSKFYALKYAAVRAEQVASGSYRGRTCQSITPKLEDLRLVWRWINSFGIPHYYLQVFFDSAFILPFGKALDILASNAGQFELERNRNNQDKPTIHIPVTQATQVGEFIEVPTFEAEVRTTNLHRLDAYVVPRGGQLRLETESLVGVLTREYEV